MSKVTKLRLMEIRLHARALKSIGFIKLISLKINRSTLNFNCHNNCRTVQLNYKISVV